MLILIWSIQLSKTGRIYFQCSIPEDATGKNYCILETSGSGHLFGYERMYVLEDECVEGILCQNGKLTISPYVFGYIGCAITANSESYDLSPVKTAFQSKVAGRFRASFNVIENPRLKLKWKGYLPSELLCN